MKMIEPSMYDAEDDKPVISIVFRNLLRAFSNFVIVDEYEIFLELIKGELKRLDKVLKSGKAKG